MKQIFILFILIFSNLVLSWHNIRTIQILKKEKLSAPISELEKRANSGDVNAQYELARAYLDGNGVGKNAQKVFEYATLAHSSNHVGGSYLLGVLYLTGNGVKKDEAKAFDCFTKASQKGNSLALVMLAKMYTNGIYVEKNLDKVCSFF